MKASYIMRDLEGEEHQNSLLVHCFKPTTPAAPTAENVYRLTLLQHALGEAIEAQKLCLDAQALLAACSLLLKELRGHAGNHGSSR